MANEAIEGDEWATYGALETYHLDETRNHLRVRAYGDRALIVLAGVTPWKASMERLCTEGSSAGGDILRGKSTRCAYSEHTELPPLESHMIRKRSCVIREEADGEGPALVPRQRPTS